MTQNAAVWFADRHAESAIASKVAFREVAGLQRDLTFAELSLTSGCVAAALKRSGVQPGERAAMFVLDQLEFPQLFWGALKAGVEPVPLNTLLSTDVYSAILNDCEPTIAFISKELVDVVMPAAIHCKSLKTIVVIDAKRDHQAKSWDQFIADTEPLEAIDRSADDIAFWLYSSGSTGAPKGVRHRHESLRYTCDTYAAQVLGVRESDTVFSAAKLFFAYGMGNGMSFPLSVGATALLFNGRPTPESVSDILAQHKPTIYCGVPTLYAALLHSWQQADSRPDAPLRICISAGEALPADIGQRWKELWEVDILDGVGSTEMLHIFLSNAPDDVVYGTSGTAVPGYELRLVDEAGDPVVRGGLGELLVRGNSSATDYWKQPEKTQMTFEGDWTRTGDKYEMTDSGRYVYCGRADDMFKVSGIWVSPFEVEQALIAHPSVLEAAVVAQQDEDGLNKPKAFVVLKDEHESDAIDTLKDFIKQRIGKWKYPRWIEVVDDLPKTATGKIQRFKLRTDH
ncbi:MAG: benzoate-CoA ligase family protein [Granulosicoccus sp.]